MYHPTRGGTRGGQAEFSWDQVRNDKDREHYLGHAVMAPTGRWQNGRDVNWYNKDAHNDADKDKDRAARLEELRQIKLAEEQALASVLGYVPKSSSGGAVGSALLAGSASRPVGASGSTGANTAPLDPTKARWPGANMGSSSSAGPSSSSLRRDKDDDKASHTHHDEDDGSGLTKEERRAARKLAKLEVKNQLKSDKELRAAEREAKRARKREREERRAARHGDRDDASSKHGDNDDEEEERRRRRKYDAERRDDGRSRGHDRERPSDRRSFSPARRDDDHTRRREHAHAAHCSYERGHHDHGRRHSRSRSPDVRDRRESGHAAHRLTRDKRDREHDRPHRREDDYYGRITSSRNDRRSRTPPFHRS